MQARPARFKNVTPPCRLDKLTEKDLRVFLSSVRGGETPYVAAIYVLGIPARTFFGWSREVEKDQDCEDPVKLAFFDHVHQAEAQARGEAEAVVFTRDPLSYLRHSPAGRTQKDRPGWTDERIVRHGNQNGDGPPTVRLEITVGGARTMTPDGQPLRQLLEAGEDGGE